MSPTPQILDPLSFPLHGLRLIEASAGTGKTYTISSLYLRLILGHGFPNQTAQHHLRVDQILIVTFTEVAAQELKNRIRTRLHEAKAAFLTGQSSDAFIQKLLKTLDRHDERVQLLLAAERQMDEAAVFTIHSFCQRMLQQYAFESGTLFSNELITDESILLQQTTEDFWRRFLYQLDKPIANLSRKFWKTPNDLLLSIRSLLGKPTLQIFRESIPNSLAEFRKQYVNPAISIRNLWKEKQQEIENLLLSSELKKTAKPLTRLVKMADFAASDELAPNLGRNESWEIYGYKNLKQGLTKYGTVPQHQVFDRINELLKKPLSIEEAFKGMVIADSVSIINSRLHKLKTDKHQMTFDDLLGKMYQTLESECGHKLAQAIQDQFCITMIDEFQDTDPLQYSIFRRIYRPSQSDEQHSQITGLFMIGDPKQAIYAFRGADIFTYMQARKQISSYYSLNTNWRSTSHMVDSINRIFTLNKTSFIYADIDFKAVLPSPFADKKRLMDHGEQLPAVQFWLHDNKGQAIGNSDYEKTMTQATATEVNRLLSNARNRLCTIESDDCTSFLQAGDIAILVRTSHQGKMIQLAMSQQGISSIYLSSRNSVFSCQEARDILKLLAACLTPGHQGRTLKAALASPLLHMTALELNALNNDEQIWEAAVEEFREYYQIWQNNGILSMLRTFISNRKIAERLLVSGSLKVSGERRLTDLLHIGELLASASLKLASPYTLYRWLLKQVRTPDVNADEQHLHIASERNVVQIVTIHKSKGLEYPVVFLPFACNFREAQEPVYHDGHHSILDLSNNQLALQHADKERIAEDLRLFYVALTRAVHTCYVGVAPIKKGSGRKCNKTDLHKSAVGWLLNGADNIFCQTLSDRLNLLSSQIESITVSSIPDTSLPPYKPPEDDKLELVANEFHGSIQKNWGITSYSTLSKLENSDQKRGIDIIAQVKKNQLLEEVHEKALTIFTFPKGSRSGNFFHTLFEEFNILEIDQNDLSQYVIDQLLKAGYEKKWTKTLVNMLENCLNAELNDTGLTLNNLTIDSKQAEMEFYIPISRLNTIELSAVIASEDHLSAQAGTLNFAEIQGMLKGFIDLTFVHQERWYVLDYKSNWLGNQRNDYNKENMALAMIKHRYDLQYQLYSLALHRLLKTRLPQYAYEKNFGGVFYLFLRGIRKNTLEKHGIYEYRPTFTLIEKLDQLFDGSSVLC